MNFADQLAKEIENKNSRVCVGLDSDFSKLPKEYSNWADKGEAVFDFNKRIIDAVKEESVVVKPNLAFYLALGDDGWKALKKTIAHAKTEGLLSIVDCKANDVGNTAEAYAKAFYDDLEADAITANPLLGTDSMLPFLKYCGKDKGIFVLTRTSNPSANEFQGLKITARENVSAEIAKKIVEWEEYGLGEKGFSSVGAVVGATFPDEANKLRRIMHKQFFLVPGYGAQGADAKTISGFFNKNGLGAIVNSSRGIIFASSGKDFAEKADSEASKMKKEINKAIGV
jgi:orotidine-5'-phosphate decarboxylase